MPSYRVQWEIDIEADTPREAAEQALAIQRKEGSSAVVFDCFEESGEAHRVDLDEPAPDNKPLANGLYGQLRITSEIVEEVPQAYHDYYDRCEKANRIALPYSEWKAAHVQR